MSTKSEAIAGIVDNLQRIIQVVNEQSKISERETGLTGPQQWAIKAIAEAEPVMVSELARRMHLHPATIGGILDRLETRGLITRTRSLEDRRVVHVDLTSQGKLYETNSPEVVHRLLMARLEDLYQEEIDRIALALKGLAKILGASENNTKPINPLDGLCVESSGLRV